MRKTQLSTMSKIQSITSFSDNLITIYCSHRNVIHLPLLPNTLLTLDCSHNNIACLPHLPKTLQSLNCSYNCLDELPTLPDSIIKLICSDNRLSTLPKILGHPDVMELDCSDNLLTEINPSFTHNLTYLCCSNNYLSELPSNLSHAPLNELYCYGNVLTRLPKLPSCLLELHCEDNKLYYLPSIYLTSLEVVNCSNNNITTFPLAINKQLKQFNATNNQIQRIGKLRKNVKWSLENNPILLDGLIQNKHIMGFKELHAIKLTEKHAFRKKIPVTFNITDYISSFFWLEGCGKKFTNPEPDVVISFHYQDELNKKQIYDTLCNLIEVCHRRMFMCISWTSFNQRILPKYNERTMCFIHRNGL